MKILSDAMSILITSEAFEVYPDQLKRRAADLYKLLEDCKKQ